jgi:uncharacterized membrane protein
VKTGWRIETVLLVVVAAMFIGAAAAWRGAPDQIPMHWNIDGQIDRYGGKFEGLFLLPLLALGLYLAMRFLPAVDPGRANYARFGGAYATIRAGIVLVMAAVHAVVLLWTQGIRIDVSMAVPFLVGALFIVFGALMGKIRPNWFVGIRTPWTMSSKQAWVRTHRLGGFLFIALGIVFIVTGLAKVRWFAYVAMGGVFAVVAILAAYSYWVWRGDTEKLPPVGTQPGDDV